MALKSELTAEEKEELVATLKSALTAMKTGTKVIHGRI